MLSVSSSDLSAMLNKLQINTSNFIEKTKECQEHLSSIEAKVKPIQKSTELHAEKKKLCETRIYEIDKIMYYISTSTNVKPIVETYNSSSPNNTSDLHYKALFEALTRLHEAKIFLKDYQSKISGASTELEAVNELFQITVKLCIDGFRDALKNFKSVVGADSFSSEEAVATLEYCQVTAKSLDSCGTTEHYGAYYTSRAEILKKQTKPSVKSPATFTTPKLTSNLLRTSSQPEYSLQQLSGVEAWDSLSSEVPYRKGENPMQTLCAECINSLQGEIALWSRIFSPATVHASEAYSEVASSIIDALKKSLPILLTNSSGFADGISFLRLFNILICKLDIIDVFLRNYEEMRELCIANGHVLQSAPNSIATRSLANLRTSLVDGYFKNVAALFKLKWDEVEKSSAASFTQTLRTSVTPSFAAAFSQSNNSRDKDRDNDEQNGNGNTCDVHSMTTTVIHACRLFFSFPSVFYDNQLVSLAHELQLHVPHKAASRLHLVESLLHSLVGVVFKLADKFENTNSRPLRTLETTGHSLYGSGNLEAMSTLKLARKHLFLINNLDSICTYLLDRSALAEGDASIASANSGISTTLKSTVSGQGDDYLESANWDVLLRDVELRLQTARFDFCEVIAYATSMSAEDSVIFKTQYHKEDKTGKAKVLKAKFSLFNSGMKALESMRGEWRVISPKLRESLTAELVQTIVPPYTEFWKAHSQENFSKKHMSEYLEYEPAAVSNIMSKFF